MIPPVNETEKLPDSTTVRKKNSQENYRLSFTFSDSCITYQFAKVIKKQTNKRNKTKSDKVEAQMPEELKEATFTEMGSLGCVLTAIFSIYLIARQSTNCMLFLLCCFFSFSRVTLSPSSLQLFFFCLVIRQNTEWCSVSYDAHTTFLFFR